MRPTPPGRRSPGRRPGRYIRGISGPTPAGPDYSAAWVLGSPPELTRFLVRILLCPLFAFLVLFLPSDRRSGAFPNNEPNPTKLARPVANFRPGFPAWVCGDLGFYLNCLAAFIFLANSISRGPAAFTIYYSANFAKVLKPAEGLYRWLYRWGTP